VTTRDLLLHAWTWRPAVALVLAAAIALHFARLRGSRPWRARTAALLAAASAIVLALASPIDALARGTLFSAHMLQHLLLALVAPPLLLLALPATRGEVSRPAMPGLATGIATHAAPGARRAPAIAFWAMGVGAMWIWHAPALCNAAATSDAVRALQNVSLPAMGLAFWWPVLGPRIDRRLPDLTAIAYLFTACVACTILGISIAFSPVEVCSAYGHGADPLGALPLVRGQWGLTPAVDQQLGGLLMWVPGCAVYAGAILAMVARFYGAPHAKAQGAS
jgi:putative membrane protein